MVWLLVVIGIYTVVRQTAPQPYVVLIRALADANEVIEGEHSFDTTEYKYNQIKWRGSGCFIRPNLILTAGHVVDNTTRFEIVLSNGKVRPGFFEYQEDKSLADVGLIRVRGSYPVTHFGKFPRLGQDVWISGYALAEMPLTLTRGIVSCVDRDTDFFGRINLLQVDSASWPGHSGSPVLNKYNQIIGMLIGGLIESDNWSICVGVDVIKLSLIKYDASKALESRK